MSLKRERIRIIKHKDQEFKQRSGVTGKENWQEEQERVGAVAYMAGRGYHCRRRASDETLSHV